MKNWKTSDLTSVVLIGTHFGGEVYLTHNQTIMNTNNNKPTTESGLIANYSPEMQIVDMPMMTMPTVGQIATVLGNKLDEKVVAPVQLTAEEIAMNVRAAGNAMSQDGMSRGVAAGAAKLGAGVVAVAAMASCTETTIDPNAIDYSTDNPAHKAEFMKDVESVKIYGSAGEIWEFSFQGVWNWKEYKLSTVCRLNAEWCAEQLRIDAKRFSKEPEQMGMEFYYRNSWWSTSIVWSIPYLEFINNTGAINLKDNKFDKYLQNNTVWSYDNLISKKESWWLRISTWYKFTHSSWLEAYTVSNQIITLIPYVFGTSN